MLVHHTIERREDAASAQLLLDLAHLYPGQLLGQFRLLHIVARLVVLALGGTLLLVQTIQALELGASVTQIAPLSCLFRPRLLQREAQGRAVQAQQLVPRLHPAAKLGYPLHPAAHFGAERRLLAARHRAADPDIGPRLSLGHLRQGHHLALRLRGQRARQQQGTHCHPCETLCHRELLAQARCRMACGTSTRSPSRRKAGSRIRVNRVLQLMPPTMTVASPR